MTWQSVTYKFVMQEIECFARAERDPFRDNDCFCLFFNESLIGNESDD